MVFKLDFEHTSPSSKANSTFCTYWKFNCRSMSIKVPNRALFFWIEDFLLPKMSIFYHAIKECERNNPKYFLIDKSPDCVTTIWYQIMYFDCFSYQNWLEIKFIFFGLYRKCILQLSKNRWVNIKIIALDSTSLAIQYIPNKMIFVSKTSSVKIGF